MTQVARLITPDGKAIDLPTEVYHQVKRMLETRQQRTLRARVQGKAAIQAGYGLLAGDGSLTKALLAERSAERAGEDIKLARFTE